MIAIEIPGFGALRLQHLAIDFDGTLAIDHQLHLGMAGVLRRLSDKLEIHVIAGDESGEAERQLAGLPLRLHRIPAENQAQAKLDYVQALDTTGVVAIGNGRNDRLMIGAAALGIAVVHKEGAAREVVDAADLVTGSVSDAFDLLLHPGRLLSTLRS